MTAVDDRDTQKGGRKWPTLMWSGPGPAKRATDFVARIRSSPGAGAAGVLVRDISVQERHSSKGLAWLSHLPVYQVLCFYRKIARMHVPVFGFARKLMAVVMHSRSSCR